MDQAIPKQDLAIITTLFESYEEQKIRFHSLKTRISGTQRFISFHVLVPGQWTVSQGHDICENLEQAIAQSLPGARISTHLEPLEDPRSWNHDSDVT